MALLKVANLKKSYVISKIQKQEVLKGIDIEFKSGDLIALLGESGCGKSTLINILGGLDTDYTGSVIIKNEFIRDFSEKQMDDYRKKRVGLIFQNYNLIPHMTIADNIEIAMAISDIDKKTRQERTMDLLKLVGLANFANKFPNQLSGGQKQRVAIARALANNPTIILADEPTGALDEESSQVVMDILKKIAESGKLVIIVTHSDKIARQCGRIVKMEDGKIAYDSAINKLKIASTRDKEIVPKNIKQKNVLKLAKNNILHQKQRSMLVSIGMSIGIMAVMLILCLSSGLSKYINNVYADSFQSLQLAVTTKNSSTISSSQQSYISNLDGAKNVYYSYFSKNAKYCSTSYGTFENLQAVYPYFVGSCEPELLHGSIKEDDTENYIVISEGLAQKLNSESLVAVIGETIYLEIDDNQKSFKITGVISGDEETAFASSDSIKQLLGGDEAEINFAYVIAKSGKEISALKSDLKSLGFSVSQSESSLDSVMKYIDLGTTLLTIVGAVSLIISAIMIFIVLYISVNERMKEIGILRAIGARKKDIRNMFMFEAGLLGLFSGMVAVAMCFVLSLITNLICLYSIHYSLISYNIGYYLLGCVASLLIGILSGISPAIKASELDPVEALRAE